MSWKPEVQVQDQGDRWHANGLAFATEDEAIDYYCDLLLRWRLVVGSRAVESDQPVNAKWVNGKLEIE